MSFLKNFIGTKGHDAVAAFTKAVVQLDPVAASAADLLTMEQDLDKAGRAIASLRTELSTEQKEYDAVNSQYAEMMSAAELLQTRITAAKTDEQKASLEKSLANLVSKIEPMVAQLDRHKHDMEQTQALLTDAESVYQEKANSLTSAKSNLDAARHDLQHANLEEERSKQRADQAAVVAGLRTSNTTGLNTALSVLQQSATEARERATAAEMKAKSLGAATTGAHDDNIASALAEVRSHGESSTKSLTERLAGLKR